MSPRFKHRSGVGKRLRNGRYAVPVVRGDRTDSTASVYFWDLDLACGCALRGHRTWRSEMPGLAGCPVGHGREIATVRTTAARASEDVEAAVASVLSSWTESRGGKGAEPGKETAGG